jgi:Predicted integral membrane protein
MSGKYEIKCEIIEDLLPLYYDGICSKETSKAVEEHMKTCKNCKLIFAEILYDSAWCRKPWITEAEMPALS